MTQHEAALIVLGFPLAACVVFIGTALYFYLMFRGPKDGDYR